ncbi:MAG: flagellar hook-associated protein 1 [Clostridia bacterium]|nr:flagellar hook-associated protein 1 [Clostridia bacterium]
MPGTFFGINTALRGLLTHQKALETTAHNIANANTPGYTRQQVIMAATPAYPVPAMSRPGGQGWQVGTGVDAQEVRRIRDEFLDKQIWHESHTLGAWERRRDVLQEIEVVFAEPSDTGLSTLMSQFWASWQELSKYAESSPVRTTVVETATALAEALRHTYQQLETIREDINQMMEIKVIEINSLARQIADLNKQIAAIKAAGDQPNDLMDQRDKLLDELAKIIDFRVQEQGDGSVQVFLADSSGNYTIDLVEVNTNGKLVRKLDVNRDGDNNTIITWVDNDLSDGITVANDAVNITNGELYGLQVVRDEQLAVFKANLDTLANGLRDRVNVIHQAGKDLHGNDGRVFFTGNNGAADIDVNPAIRSDVTLIAAAGTAGGPGDGSNALSIAQLQHELLQESDSDSDGYVDTLVTGSGGVTFDDYYKNFTARLGVAAHEAVRMVENQNVLVQQLTNRRESISGVSLDEEMAYMIQFQHAYNAAARMISTFDEMLDTIINRMAAH